MKTKKEDLDVFDQVDEPKKMDGKKVAMMLGNTIWLTIKFILYVHPFLMSPRCERLDKDADGSAAAMSAIGKPTHTHSHPSVGGGGDKIQSLRVWEPPSFCMAFFWYVPLQHLIHSSFFDPCRLVPSSMHMIAPLVLLQRPSPLFGYSPSRPP